jgi:hypothetical protein
MSWADPLPINEYFHDDLQEPYLSPYKNLLQILFPDEYFFLNLIFFPYFQLITKLTTA